MLTGGKLRIIMIDELSRITEELLKAINTGGETIIIDSIPEELHEKEGLDAVIFRGQSKQRMLTGLAAMELRMASPMAVAEYARPQWDYEKNPPRVPKNLKQTKAPKHNFRAQMRSVNRNR